MNYELINPSKARRSFSIVRWLYCRIKQFGYKQIENAFALLGSRYCREEKIVSGSQSTDKTEKN